MNNLLFSMADKLFLEQRRVTASLKVFGSQTRVRQKFAKRFTDCNPPSHLTIYHIHANFVLHNNRRNVARPRTGRSDVNIACVQRLQSRDKPNQQDKAVWKQGFHIQPYSKSFPRTLASNHTTLKLFRL